MSANWEPISEDDVKDWRKHLDKGTIRESNTARTVGYEEVEADGDSVTITKAPTHIAQAAVPREVAQEIFGMMWEWGRKSPDAFALMVQIMRNSNPEAFGHLSDDELRTKIEQHAKDAARQATEDVYAGQWDKGNDLDMWQGKPLVYSNPSEDLIVLGTNEKVDEDE